MRTRFIIVTFTVLALLAGMLSLSGCNTWKGAGKDVENAGDAMQK